MEEKLYATKYELFLSLITTIIVISIVITTLYNNPSPNLYPISILIVVLMIIINIYVYLSYKGKFPLYTVKNK